MIVVDLGERTMDAFLSGLRPPVTHFTLTVTVRITPLKTSGTS